MGIKGLILWNCIQILGRGPGGARGGQALHSLILSKNKKGIAEGRKDRASNKNLDPHLSSRSVSIADINHVAAVEGINCLYSIFMTPKESNKFIPIQHFTNAYFTSCHTKRKLNYGKDYHTLCETNLAKLALKSNLALFLLFMLFWVINP